MVLRNILAALVNFGYRDFTFYVLAFQLSSPIDSSPLYCMSYNPVSSFDNTVWAIPVSLALLRESLWFLFLQVLRFFNSLRSLSFRNGPTDRVSPFGNPWVEACFAATQGLSQLYHVLHRFLLPRHPPCTLISLKIISMSLNCRRYLYQDRSLNTLMSIFSSETTAHAVFSKAFSSLNDVNRWTGNNWVYT